MKVNNIEIEERIFQKTHDLILARGLRGWNMDTLAKECGLAKNTLYKIIGSKETLFEKIVMRQLSKNLQLVDRMIQASDDYSKISISIPKRFSRLVSRFEKKALSLIYLEYPGIEKKAKNLMRDLASNLISAIRKGQENKTVRDDVEPEFIFEIIKAVSDHYVLRSDLEGIEFENAYTKAMLCLNEGIIKHKGEE